MRDTIKLTATAAALISSLVVFGAPPAAAQVNPPSYGTGPGASGLPGPPFNPPGPWREEALRRRRVRAVAWPRRWRRARA